jgi:2'-5' RNA ligase
VRLFVGIALDDAARAACAAAAERLRRTGFSARYEDPSKMHVTLAFLGSVDAERLATIEDVMVRAAAPCDLFTLTFDKVGAFPHERKPRVIYAGARAQGGPFRTLCERLRGAYGEMGFQFHDDPVAHVTIARVKGGSLRPLPSIEPAPALLRVDCVTLFESTYDKAQDTSRYETRRTVRLSGA